MEWKSITDYPKYEVSNHGGIRNKKTKKLLKARINGYGYGRVTLYNQDGASDKSVHRIVAQEFCDGYENGLDVNHIDGCKANNRADNLEWCTRSENIKHAFQTHLRDPSGPYAMVKVRVIETGDIYRSARECARAINGSQAHISRCLNGEYKSYRGLHFERVDELREVLD